MKNSLKNILTGALFISGLIGIILAASYFLAPVQNEKNIGLLPPVLYECVYEPKDSIDVLFLGNSETRVSMNPLQLWEEYGYSSVCCGTSGQSVSQANMILNFAAEYQSPEIVVVETDMLYTHNSFYRAFLDRVQSFLPVFITHNRWKSVYDARIDTLSDYINMTETKNFHYTTEIISADTSNYMTPSEDCEPIPFVNWFYLRKIKKCCDKMEAKLFLVSAPSVKNWTTARHNGVLEFAKKNNVDFIDMNVLQDEIPIDWNTDTLDQGDHVNYYGSKKTTAYLGNYLFQTGLLKSHKGDSGYDSWNVLVKKFYDQTNQ